MLQIISWIIENNKNLYWNQHLELFLSIQYWLINLGSPSIVLMSLYCCLLQCSALGFFPSPQMATNAICSCTQKISMARSNSPNTTNKQTKIAHHEYPRLPKCHTVKNTINWVGGLNTFECQHDNGQYLYGNHSYCEHKH